MKAPRPPLLLLLLLLSSSLKATAQPRVDKNLTQKLEQLLNDFDGKTGVYVYNLKTKKEASVRGDHVFPTASIIKVPILIGIFKKIINDTLGYHKPLIYRDSMAQPGAGIMNSFKDHSTTNLSIPINLMISYSDNTAALWIQELAGGGKTINTWLKNHGYQHTRINAETKGRDQKHKEKYGWGQTTPKEMAHLLMAIKKRKILTPAACDRIYRTLTKSYWDHYALSQIPPNVQTASKQGMLARSRSELVMVNAPHGDYVFYLATDKNGDKSWKTDNSAWQLSRKVSKLLWLYFEPQSNWEPAKGAAKYY